MLLPEVSSEQADVVAAALVESVRELEHDPESRRSRSASVSSSSTDADRLSEDRAMVGADLAMYAAKHGGRDRHAPFSARTLEEAEAMLLAAPVASPDRPGQY